MDSASPTGGVVGTSRGCARPGRHGDELEDHDGVHDEPAGGLVALWHCCVDLVNEPAVAASDRGTDVEQRRAYVRGHVAGGGRGEPDAVTRPGRHAGDRQVVERVTGAELA